VNVRLNTVRAARDDDDADAPRRRRASVTTRAGDDDGARVGRLRRSRATSVFRRPSRAGRTIAARRARRPTTTDRRRPTDATRRVARPLTETTLRLNSNARVFDPFAREKRRDFSSSADPRARKSATRGNAREKD